MARIFTDAERRILAIVQKDLPDTLTPFADIAKAVGPDVTEDMVITLLSRLKEEGVIATSNMRRPMENLTPEQEKALLARMKELDYKHVIVD